MALGMFFVPGSVLAENPVSFRNDVMAILSKAGCNAGACHGNANGKAGFKLSLRGQDPDIDYQVLTRDLFSRRTNPLDVEQSLILLKATTAVSHEGGLRFRPDSNEYRLLQQWISAGTSNDLASSPSLVNLEVSPQERFLDNAQASLPLSVRATFSDSTTKDVRSLAVYEVANTLAEVTPDGTVQRRGFGETTVLVRYLDQQKPVRLAFLRDVPVTADAKLVPNNFVDEQVFKKWKDLRLQPAPLASDGEFVRRVYLDLLGVLPTVDEARQFVGDTHPQKRTYLVDQLLERPEFADFWALKWSDLLKNEEKVLDRKGVQAFHHWIRQSIATNKPLDQFARELVTARGSTYENPPANYYRANRDAVTRAEATAQLFLGVRLGCAKCHNHPFDRWTQADYYNWAAVFAQVNYKVLENRRRDNNDNHEFVGEQIVWWDRQARITNPKTEAAAPARFLGLPDPGMLNEGAETGARQRPERLEALGEWLTAKDNPFFARVQANRIWFHLFGRGIVEPIDDFRVTNPASIPALLDALAADFVTHAYDLRHLIRTITASRTYQLSGQLNASNRDDEANFARAYLRRLSAEQMLDAQYQVLGIASQFNGYPRGLRAAEIPGVRATRVRDGKLSSGDMFLEVFGKPPRLLTCECERTSETSLTQAFNLISGPAINAMLTSPDNRLSTWLRDDRSYSDMLDELYWAALSRPPETEEQTKAVSYLKNAPDKRQALEDVAWALFNAKEFVFRR